MRLLLLFTLLLNLPAHSAQKPNFLVIMVDDLGYSDIGCYGSEIETPNLDRLAKNGLRFSQFYNTAKCHSSRVSLLTGQYCVAAGDVALSHAVTSAEVLRGGGYFTAMSGKWHLKKEPTDFGFDRYFGHLSGACNFFKGDNTFRLNGKPWKVPDTGFYTTVAKVDHALKFLEESRKADDPFYLYLAFNAPHAPLHALPEDYAKYKGRYDAGWDKVRDTRIAKQKELGILPKNLKASPRPPHIRAWDKLVPWQRDYEINRMVTLAAMIDRVDQEIGRLINDLEKNKQLDNTFILFVSDNGACPYDRRKPLLDVEPTNGDIALADSTGWAWARNAPFRFYKQNQFEGGISTPGILHWPAGTKLKPGAVIDTPVHLIDVLPTLAEISKSTIPAKHPTRELRPVSGVSFLPIIENTGFTRPEPLYLQFAKDFGLRDGDWKLVNFKGQEWELYNLAEDRSELNNLATAEPKRLQSMITKWQEISRNVLHSESIANTKLTAASNPKGNREWTKFSDTNEPPTNAQKKGSRTGKPPIRSRKNTKLTRKDNTLQLTFTGDDPGIAMDFRRTSKPPVGPYFLSFTLTTENKDTGHLYFTTNQTSVLPKAAPISFPVNGDNTPQKIRIAIDTNKSLHQLRLDVSSGPGKAIIEELKLLGQNKKTLLDWTSKKKTQGSD